MRAYRRIMLADQHPCLFGGYAKHMNLLPGSLLYKVAEGVPDFAASLSSVIDNGVRWIKILVNVTFG